MSALIPTRQLADLLELTEGLIGHDLEDRKRIHQLRRELRQRYLDSIHHDATGHRPSEACDG